MLLRFREVTSFSHRPAPEDHEQLEATIAAQLPLPIAPFGEGNKPVANLMAAVDLAAWRPAQRPETIDVIAGTT